MDPHRNYPDQAEPGWFDGGEREPAHYARPPAQRRYEPDRRHYEPEPRYEPDAGEPRSPRPPDDADDEPWHPTEAIDVSEARRAGPDMIAPPLGAGGPSGSAGLPGAVPGGVQSGVPAGVPAPVGGATVYRSRRPALVVLLAVLTIALAVPAVRVLVSAAFATRVDLAGTVAGMALVAAVPTLALGVYGLIANGGAAPGLAPAGWLRPPLAYLPVALALFLCAALAAT